MSVWTTKDGREIPIVDLESDHLVNIIKFLRRNCERLRYAEVLPMLEYATYAPDGASSAVEYEVGEIAEMEDDEFLGEYHMLNELLAEARKRGLNVDGVPEQTADPVR